MIRTHSRFPQGSSCLRSTLMVLVASVLAVSGCRPAYLVLPVGEVQSSGRGGSLAVARQAELLITIRWPRRDLPGFRAASIPSTTNTLVITVSGQGRQPVSKTISRPEGQATEPVPARLAVPEGTDLTVEVKAYREKAPLPESAEAIASATKGIPAAVAGKLIAVPITLTATFAPTVSSLSAYASPTGFILGVTGTNFGTASVPVEIRFGGKDGLAADPATVTRISGTQLTARVPAQAVTGPLVVVADGIPSEENTVFWVMSGDPDLKISVNSNYTSIVLGNGATASIGVEQNIAFRFPIGKAAGDFSGKPDRAYAVSDTDVATVSVGTGTADTLQATAAGSSTFKARLGSVESNEMTVTVTKGFNLQTIAGKGGGIGDGGSAASAELQQPLGIAVTAAGDLLVADQGHHRIRRLGSSASTEAGTGFVGLVNGATSSAKFSSPAGLALDSTGSLYVADQGNHAVRKISGGTVTTLAGNGQEGFAGDGSTATLGQLAYPQGVAVTAEGHVIVADTYNNRIRIVAASDGSPFGFSMTAGMMYTLAGSATAGSADGSRLQAKFDTPAAVAVDATGSVYVADSGNNKIRKIAIGTGTVSTVAGDGNGAFGGDGNAAIAASLYNPTGIAVAASGSIYVADTGNERVRVFVEGGTIATLAGTGTAGTSGDGGAATSAKLSAPKALALSASALYIADFGTNRIRKVVLATGIISTAAGAGTGDGSAALDTALANPLGVTLDGAGKPIVVDTDRNQLRRLEDDNTFTVLAGTGVASFGGDGGDPKAAGLNQPSSARLDSAGLLYVVDGRNRRIRAINQTSDEATVFGVTVPAGKIATVAGGGNSAFSEGAALGNTLLDPVAVAFSTGGDMYLTDAGANSVYKVVRTSGQMSRVAGDGSAGYAGDNSVATSARLQGPRGIVVDADGSLLFADGQNHAVRRVKDGIITTVAGNGTANFTGDNGEARSAQLNSPWDVVLDGSGGFYVTDSGNHAVRWVTSAGTIATVAGTPTSAGFSGDGGSALAGKLYEPKGMVRTAAGALIFADSGNSRIRKLTAQ